MRRPVRACTVGVGDAVVIPLAASAQEFTIKAVAEKKVKQLPAGPLFWKIETFPGARASAAAAGPTGLAAEVSGKVWLLHARPEGWIVRGQRQGHRDQPCAARCRHRNICSGSIMPAVRRAPRRHRIPIPALNPSTCLPGGWGKRTPHGVAHADAGQSINGHGADMPMVCLQRGDDRSGSTRHVRRRRHQAVLVSGQDALISAHAERRARD